jgi:hypothetical protein
MVHWQLMGSAGGCPLIAQQLAFTHPCTHAHQTNVCCERCQTQPTCTAGQGWQNHCSGRD